MKKQLNIALLPAAVAAALLSGNVMAGTESCFENWDQDVNWSVEGPSYAEVKYSLANCNAEYQLGSVDAGSIVSGATGLISDSFTPTGRPQNTANLTIAREVSQDFTWSQDASDSAAGGIFATNQDVNLTYIPTTDLPGGSYITMDLNGADFGKDNNDQIFLLGWDSVAGVWQVLATSDGVVNDKATVTFLSQSGSPIGAGTRMVMSTSNSLPTPIKLHLNNTDCSLMSHDVTLTVSNVVTAGGQPIAGGIGAKATVAKIQQQFQVVVKTADDEVDAANEAESREKFDNEQYTSKAAFYIEDASTASWAKAEQRNVELEFTPTFTGNAGAGVVFYVEDTADSVVDLNATDSKIVPDGTVTYKLTEGGATGDVAGLFQSAGSVAAILPEIVIENVGNNGVYSPMNFNYDVVNGTKVTFKTPGLEGNLNGCQVPVTSHNVGVNGAVLKVPYMRMSGKDQFVKITNESGKEATILLDLFTDAADGAEGEINGVSLGKIAAKQTRLFYGEDLAKAAASEGYANATYRSQTATFVVTAPESSVHGVSTQKVPGQSDRVQPVLRGDSEIKSISTNVSGGAATIVKEATAWKW